jgi:hypothetical protein
MLITKLNIEGNVTVEVEAEPGRVDLQAYDAFAGTMVALSSDAARQVAQALVSAQPGDERTVRADSDIVTVERADDRVRMWLTSTVQDDGDFGPATMCAPMHLLSARRLAECLRAAARAAEPRFVLPVAA